MRFGEFFKGCLGLTLGLKLSLRLLAEKLKNNDFDNPYQENAPFRPLEVHPDFRIIFDCA